MVTGLPTKNRQDIGDEKQASHDQKNKEYNAKDFGSFLFIVDSLHGASWPLFFFLSTWLLILVGVGSVLFLIAVLLAAARQKVQADISQFLLGVASK